MALSDQSFTSPYAPWASALSDAQATLEFLIVLSFLHPGKKNTVADNISNPQKNLFTFMAVWFKVSEVMLELLIKKRVEFLINNVTSFWEVKPAA
jgi:hypothetical protein